MNKYDRIKQIKNIARNDKEAITMLLSACADMGSEKGAFLSVAIFDDAAEIILEYLADRHLTQQCSGQKQPSGYELSSACSGCSSTSGICDCFCR